MQPMTAQKEESAGALLVRTDAGETQALLIRVRKSEFEIPKGHIEESESAEEAAERELREETGILSDFVIGPKIGEVEYSFSRADIDVRKCVTYFAAFSPVNDCKFGKKPRGTRQLKWITNNDVESIPLVNEASANDSKRVGCARTFSVGIL